jgi:hypothetical protein
MKSILCAIALCCTSAFGQGWALPAKVPDTPVSCTACPERPTDSLTVGYKAPIVSFTGRFLDSTNTSEWEKPFRTARAKFVLPMPSLDRIYFRFGDGTIASYKLSTFFSRLAAGEALSYSASTGQQFRGGHPEVWLRWDSWFNHELGGWRSKSVDSTIRMTAFDVDDQGYVYLAATLDGWGIVKDDFNVYAGAMATQVQRFPSALGDAGPAMIASVKGSSRYYVILGGHEMWDVTNRRAPVRIASNSAPRLNHFAKDSTGTRLAVIDDIGTMTINTGDGFASASPPLFSASGYADVTSDGTNFFALKYPEGIVVLSPSGNGYAQTTAGAIDPKFAGANTLKYGAGYLVLTGSDSGGGWDLRLYSIGTDLKTTPIAMNASIGDPAYPSYFRNYYGVPPGAPYVVPNYVNSQDGVVVAQSGHTYLVTLWKSLGDVYEISGGAVVPPVQPPVTPPVEPPVTPPVQPPVIPPPVCPPCQCPAPPDTPSVTPPVVPPPVQPPPPPPAPNDAYCASTTNYCTDDHPCQRIRVVKSSWPFFQLQCVPR